MGMPSSSFNSFTFAMILMRTRFCVCFSVCFSISCDTKMLQTEMPVAVATLSHIASTIGRIMGPW